MRRNKIKFFKSRKYLTRDIWAEDKDNNNGSNDFSTVINFTNRKREKSVLSFMIDKKLLSAKSNHLCISCYNTASEKTGDMSHKELERKHACVDRTSHPWW